MRVRRLTSSSEARVEHLLRRALANSEYFITLQTSIQAVLEKDPGELTEDEMSLFTRGRFDFVVCHSNDHWPEFGVEFDGFGHENPKQLERDVIKNRLCASAGFPLMRVGLDELRETDQVSVLEWLVQAFVTFQKTVDALDDEPNSEAEVEGEPDEPDALDDELESASTYVFGEDGDVFESEHPFPANAAIARRLLQRFGISAENGVEGFTSPTAASPYVIEAAWPGRQPLRFEEGIASEFVISERDLYIRSRARPDQPLFQTLGRARFAWAHKMKSGSAPLSGCETREEMDRRLSPLDLLWLDPWGVARQLALHDALVKAEQWAAKNLLQVGDARTN
jgi:uncharacterized protein DUF2726